MKRHKYNAKRTTIDGFNFASQAEAKRYEELKLLWRAGEITDLVLQPRFPILVNGQKICTYIADFQYIDVQGKTHVEDKKGYRTALYSIKKKLVRACLGIEIEEV